MLFLTALFLATLGSRDALLRTLLAMILGPAGMGRIVGTTWNLPSLLILPLAYLSDRVPRRESRRHLYVLLGGLMSLGGWCVVPFVRPDVGPFAAIALVLGCATALIVVSVRGALVEAARPLAATGRLAAGLLAAQAAASLFERPVLFQLIASPLEWTAIAGSACALTLALLVGQSLVTRRARAPASTTRPPEGGRLRDYLRSRAFWALLALGTLVAVATPDYFFLYALRAADVAPVPADILGTATSWRGWPGSGRPWSTPWPVSAGHRGSCSRSPW